jgi:hypothetical protein
MAFTQVSKTYPLLRIALIVSAILAIVGIVMSDVVTDPNGADTQTFLVFVGIAVLLPFLALLWKRKEVIRYEVPSDHLASASRQDLQGMLEQLDAAKANGDLPEKARIMEAMARR